MRCRVDGRIAMGVEKDRLITERGYMMNRYIFFIKRDESKVLRKEVVTREIIKDMKRKGFRKHHIEVEADNGSDAIKKLNKNSTDYLDSLKYFSGDLLFCSICVIVMTIVYFATMEMS
uniref:Uncharacterized protein n=2 Tax=Serratia marcescens TaxID=615 RepID=A0A9X8YQM0_SERMA